MKRGFALRLTYEYMRKNWEVDPDKVSLQDLLNQFRPRILKNLKVESDLECLVKVDVHKEFLNDTVTFKVYTFSDKISCWVDLREIPEGSEYPLLEGWRARVIL